MPVSCFEQFFSFFIGDVGEFLRSRLFEYKSFYTILKSICFLLTIFEAVASLQHFKAFFQRFAHGIVLINDAEGSGGLPTALESCINEKRIGQFSESPI